MHNLHISNWLTVFVLFLGLQVPIRQAGETLVCSEPARLEIVAGQSATVQIRLLNANNVYGIDLQASFDPAVVEVVDADKKQAGIQMTPGPFISPDFVVTNLVDNKTGRLRYVATQLNPTPAAHGDGSVLLVQLRGKRPGASSRLSFGPVVVADRRGAKQPVKTQACELVILASGTDAVTTPGLTPSAEASPTAKRSKAAATPSGFADANHPFGILDNRSARIGQIIRYVTFGALFSSILIAAVCLGLVSASWRKQRPLKPVEDQKKSTAQAAQK